MKIAIIGSSGGSAFIEAWKILREAGTSHEFYVVTDRECGFEDHCRENVIPWHRIEERDNLTFSQKAKEHLDGIGSVDCVLLFFTRLITKELFDAYPIFNIHPSLLPSYKGLHPIRDMMKNGAKILGATLHQVDESVDGGPILAQTARPVEPNWDEERWNKHSFLQKVYLTLLMADLLTNNKVTFDSNAICLEDDLQVKTRHNPSLINGALDVLFEKFESTELKREGQWNKQT